MDTTTARQLLTDAVAHRDATATAAAGALEALYDTVRQVAPTMRQVDIVEITGWTREHIRGIVRGKR